MKTLVTLLSTVALSVTVATSASAAPQPNPSAPEHAGMACMAVLSHNPQAGESPRSAPQGQQNLFEVGDAFCF